MAVVRRNRQMVTGRRSADPLFVNVYELLDGFPQPVTTESKAISLDDIIAVAVSAMVCRKVPKAEKGRRWSARIPGIVGWSHQRDQQSAENHCLSRLAEVCGIDAGYLIGSWAKRGLHARQINDYHRNRAAATSEPGGLFLRYEDGDVYTTPAGRQWRRVEVHA